MLLHLEGHKTSVLGVTANMPVKPGTRNPLADTSPRVQLSVPDWLRWSLQEASARTGRPAWKLMAEAWTLYTRKHPYLITSTLPKIHVPK